MKDNELMISKRGHLIDFLQNKRENVLTRIATYNCKKNTMTLYEATSNVLLLCQKYIIEYLKEIEVNKNE